MKLRLIEIGREGAPARCPGQIPPAARDVLEGTVNLYESSGFVPPWIGYLADRDGDIVGAGAFFGAPRDGKVELGYQTFAEYEGRGVGSEIARMLVKLARDTDPSVTLLAQTEAREGASARILDKLGFAFESQTRSAEGRPVYQWQLAAETGA